MNLIERFLISLKDEHGQFNWSVIYLIGSLFFSIILLICLLFQIQERSFVEQELISQQTKYMNLQNESNEAISNYEKLQKEKEILQNDYDKLLKEKEKIIEDRNSISDDKKIIEDNYLIVKEQSESYKYKLDSLLNFLYMGVENPLDKYLNEVDTQTTIE
jgi:septal ring factor EnvC (AmiA/AmiB activator)